MYKRITFIPLEIKKPLIFWSTFTLNASIKWPKHTFCKFSQLPLGVSASKLLSAINNLRHYWIFSGILMVKDPCNLISQEPFLTNNLTFCWLNWGKSTFTSLEVNSFLFIMYFGYSQSYRLTKETLGYFHT